MPIIAPTQNLIVEHPDEDYALPLHVLDERLLESTDEDLVKAIGRYKPQTRIRPGDLVLLAPPLPAYLARREKLPEVWKVRFVLSEWGWNLIRVIRQFALLGQDLGLDQAVSFIEGDRKSYSQHYHRPMFYAHGYPHGRWPDSAAWLPEFNLCRTIYNESNESWEQIVDRAGARYLGYDTSNDPSPLRLDLAPLNYQDGANIGKPFAPEEPLVHALACLGWEKRLFSEIKPAELDRQSILDALED